MDRRKFIVGSAVSAAVATRPYVAAGQDQPLVENAQPQPLSFRTSGTRLPKSGRKSRQPSRMFYQSEAGLAPINGLEPSLGVTIMSTLRSTLATACMLCLFTLAGCSSGPRISDADWLTHNRTLPGDRFSPLKEIDRSNVAQLKAICTYTLPEVSSLQTGPIVVDGTMYFTTDEGSYAIDASTCAEKWKQHRHSDTPSMLLVNRGFAYTNGRLFRGTSDSHVLAMDPADGHQIWDHVLDVQGAGVSIPMEPIASNGLVYVGNAGGDQSNVTGHVYALDANDGHVVWKFDVVPANGPARATWTNPKYPISGGAFWTSFTLDEPNGVLYVPAGNPAPDFDSERRTGDNLYTDSVIAIDAKSGQMLAYNQLVKRDNHDWDVDSPPMLATTRSGKRIVASANKDGLLSILDRSRVSRGSPPAISRRSFRSFRRRQRLLAKTWTCRSRATMLCAFARVASGMKSPMWPGGAQQSHILVYGLH